MLRVQKEGAIAHECKKRILAMFRKTHLEKRFLCNKDKIRNILLTLGYTQNPQSPDFYRGTQHGRLHIKLNSMTADTCKIEIHHDLTGPSHYTVPRDPIPHQALRQIRDKLLTVYGRSFEL